MPYATQADIDARYPGELAQAGPMRDGALDSDAIAAACSTASAMIDGSLRVIGWDVPLAVPPEWVVALAVDLALYLATPTVAASQGAFIEDRRNRYNDALSQLRQLARGEWLPPPNEAATLGTVYTTSRPRLFGRGSL